MFLCNSKSYRVNSYSPAVCGRAVAGDSYIPCKTSETSLSIFIMSEHKTRCTSMTSYQGLIQSPIEFILQWCENFWQVNQNVNFLLIQSWLETISGDKAAGKQNLILFFPWDVAAAGGGSTGVFAAVQKDSKIWSLIIWAHRITVIVLPGFCLQKY